MFKLKNKPFAIASRPVHCSPAHQRLLLCWRPLEISSPSRLTKHLNNPSKQQYRLRSRIAITEFRLMCCWRRIFILHSHPKQSTPSASNRTRRLLAISQIGLELPRTLMLRRRISNSGLLSTTRWLSSHFSRATTLRFTVDVLIEHNNHEVAQWLFALDVYLMMAIRLSREFAQIVWTTGGAALKMISKKGYQIKMKEPNELWSIPQTERHQLPVRTYFSATKHNTCDR